MMYFTWISPSLRVYTVWWGQQDGATPSAKGVGWGPRGLYVTTICFTQAQGACRKLRNDNFILKKIFANAICSLYMKSNEQKWTQLSLKGTLLCHPVLLSYWSENAASFCGCGEDLEAFWSFNVRVSGARISRYLLCIVGCQGWEGEGWKVANSGRTQKYIDWLPRLKHWCLVSGDMPVLPGTLLNYSSLSCISAELLRLS